MIKVEQNVIVNQPFGIGDIIWSQTLVRKVANGGKIIWPVLTQFLDQLIKAYPGIEFIDSKNLPFKFDFNSAKQQKISCRGETYLTLSICHAQHILKVPDIDCMKAKYAMLGQDYKVWKEQAMWRRDVEAENELFQYRSVPYAFINKTWGSEGKFKANIPDITDMLNVEMTNREGYSLFDWALCMENATEIHTVSTSIIYLLEQLDLKAKVVHLYPRVNVVVDYKAVEYILTKHQYVFHDFPVIEQVNNKVEKAVYTFWESDSKKTNAGFTTVQDLVMTLTLSLEQTLKQFKEVELVTNTYGNELLINQYHLPFTSVRVVLDQFNKTLPVHFWSYIKIYSYAIQDKPFCHLDIDVILWDQIPDRVLIADLAFQNKESLAHHKLYKPLCHKALQFPKIDKDILMQKPQYALNCGVVLINNLQAVKEWKRVVDEYLFTPENQVAWQGMFDRGYQNHLFEQYFISCIVKKMNIEDKVETLLSEDFYQSAVTEFRMTHLWGAAKRKIETMQKIKNRLLRDYPQYDKVFG